MALDLDGSGFLDLKIIQTLLTRYGRTMHTFRRPPFGAALHEAETVPSRRECTGCMVVIVACCMLHSCMLHGRYDVGVHGPLFRLELMTAQELSAKWKWRVVRRLYCSSLRESTDRHCAVGAAAISAQSILFLAPS